MAKSKRRSIPVPPLHTRRPRRAYWRAVLEECRGSGLSQAEFGRRRGIPAGTLAIRKHTLGREAKAVPPASTPVPVRRPAPPMFLIEKILTPLGLWPANAHSPPAGSPLPFSLQRVVAA